MQERIFHSSDFKEWERFYRAHFFNSAGGFKSANLIGTQNRSGVPNLALFFSVIHVGANPPLLGLLFRPHTVARHTLENIYATQSFTVNAVTRDMYQRAHQASAKYEEAQSEFEECGFTAEYPEKIPAPFVKESPVKLACTYREKHEIMNGCIFVVGEVLEARIRDEALQADGFIDHTKVNTVALNNLDAYHEVNLLERLPYARPEKS